MEINQEQITEQFRSNSGAIQDFPRNCFATLFMLEYGY